MIYRNNVNAINNWNNNKYVYTSSSSTKIKTDKYRCLINAISKNKLIKTVRQINIDHNYQYKF